MHCYRFGDRRLVFSLTQVSILYEYIVNISKLEWAAAAIMAEITFHTYSLKVNDLWIEPLSSIYVVINIYCNAKEKSKSPILYGYIVKISKLDWVAAAIMIEIISSHAQICNVNIVNKHTARMSHDIIDKSTH